MFVMMNSVKMNYLGLVHFAVLALLFCHTLAQTTSSSNTTSGTRFVTPGIGASNVASAAQTTAPANTAATNAAPANAAPAKPAPPNAAAAGNSGSARPNAAQPAPTNAAAAGNAVSTRPNAAKPAPANAAAANNAGSARPNAAQPAAANAAAANATPAPANAAAAPSNTAANRKGFFTEAVAQALVSPEDEVEEYPPAPEACTLPAIPKKRLLGPIISALSSGRKPNIIVVLTDDQGWDDIAMHHPNPEWNGKPRYLQTPNFDRLMRMSKEFRNFYVTPMCSQTRAELLTGRDYVRTGTLLVNGGYDYINRNETMIGDAMKAAGYKTAHFGKWHNGRTLGYEPWNMGFEDSWLPQAHIHMDNIFRHNGKYVPTKGLMEQRLMDRLIDYLKEQQGSDKPFFIYYAAHAPHQGFMFPGVGPRWQRPSPPEFANKYKAMSGLNGESAEVFAMTDYMDSVFGRLMDYLEVSGLWKDTYLFFTGDNGSEIWAEERKPDNRPVRTPSKMVGWKRDVTEGGNRHFLLAAGPGISAGENDYSLVTVKDVFNTVLDLAGQVSVKSDGLSITNLLGSKAETSDQKGRMAFHITPNCFWPDFTLPLDEDRQGKKDVPELDYWKGGKDGDGWEKCIAVRWGEWKWNGANPDTIFLLVENNHIEQPCNIYTGSDAADLAKAARTAAETWFKGLVAERHSFQKPTFYLGWNGNTETNVIADGAFDRTSGRVTLQGFGASGFSRVGDYIGFRMQVSAAGSYMVGLQYQSTQECTVKISVGSYSAIAAGDAPSLEVQLPAQDKAQYVQAGRLTLPATKQGTTEEIRVELLRLEEPGKEVFTNFEALRFSLRGPPPSAVAPNAIPKESAFIPNGAPKLNLPFKSPLMLKQMETTPAWVQNPSFYDSCEAEGVWHKSTDCGIPYSYHSDR